MRTIDADALKELFSEVIGHIAKKPEMNGNLEHMIRASAMVIQMIDDAPTVQPDTTTHDSIPAETGKNDGDRTSGDCISRQQAIDAVERNACNTQRAIDAINGLPSAQPEHCGDAVSRNAIVQKLNKMDRYVSTELRLCDTDKKFPQNEVFIVDDVYEEIVEQLPSAQPQRTCVNCGRTVNNGGWYADGGTRCPIEEHYALPKDGYCHLWEKRNVTDDNYPERREE